MTLKQYVEFNPMRTLAAVMVFGQAVLVILYIAYTWSADIQTAVNTAWVAFMGIWMSLFKSTDPEVNAGAN